MFGADGTRLHIHNLIFDVRFGSEKWNKVETDAVFYSLFYGVGETLAITVQLLYRFRSVGLGAQAGNIFSPTRSQRILEQGLESIREANVARGHALRRRILILDVRIRSPGGDVRPRADEDGVLILDHVRVCVVLWKGCSRGVKVSLSPIIDKKKKKKTSFHHNDVTDLFALLVLAESYQERFERSRARKVEALAQHGDAVPVGKNRAKPPSSRVQRLYVLLDVARADGRGRACRRWGRLREGLDRRGLVLGRIGLVFRFFAFGRRRGICRRQASTNLLATRESCWTSKS